MLRMINRSLRLLALVCLIVAFALGAFAATGYEVFVGTYTGPQSKGIYAFRFDPATGQVGHVELAAETENPSFLTVDSRHKYLYTVNELDEYKGAKSGAVSVFRIDPKTWKLMFEQQVSSLGGAPAYLTLDKTEHDLLVANYNGGNVVVFPIGADGKLKDHSAIDQHTGKGPNPERQEAPHAHSIQMTNDNRFAMSADLGLDKVIVNKFDSEHGTLTSNNPPFATVEPGSGPRHLAFASSGKFVYVLSEMATTVTVFALDAETGAMHELQTTPTVEKHDPANTAAEVALDRSGQFLYTSTRAADVISEFKVAPESGKLTLVERVPSVAKTPRFFALDPTGQWMFVAGQDSNNIVLFRVDKLTGKLTPTHTRIEVGSPVCLVFVPRT